MIFVWRMHRFQVRFWDNHYEPTACLAHAQCTTIRINMVYQIVQVQILWFDNGGIYESKMKLMNITPRLNWRCCQPTWQERDENRQWHPWCRICKIAEIGRIFRPPQQYLWSKSTFFYICLSLSNVNAVLVYLCDLEIGSWYGPIRVLDDHNCILDKNCPKAEIVL